MKLTDEQRAKLIEKLNSFGPLSGCPICNSNQWSVSDTIFELMEFQGGDLVVGGNLYPVIPLTCKICGNTYFLNSIILGIIDPQKKEDQK